MPTESATAQLRALAEAHSAHNYDPLPVVIAHAEVQRARYAARRERLRAALTAAGWATEHSEAGLYLWVARPGLDCWGSVQLLAEAGILVAPGEFYGPAGREHVRVALTATDERIDAAVNRLEAMA